ncbi:preprotein translocase subunit YajC [Pelagibius marinus]|uniref:preprotein translocase subunit YajC n=1 Tax=Pelagibius marinus TaxID=2762760 RepID=UPI0029CA80BF|nr:preprotein translocase subunit YajC [Pelagibius marinus]
MFTSLLPIFLIIIVFYFLLIRPQQKKVKQHREMVSALRRGDKIVTAGGLIGTVTKVVNEAEAMVELAEGVRVRVMRHTIQDVLSKTEAAPGKGDGGARPANDPGGRPGGLLGGGLLGSLFGGKKPDNKS